jgi:hypothetical protein
LEELRRHSQTSPAEVLRRSVDEKLAVLEASATALHFERVADVLDLKADFWVIDWQIKKSRRNLARFFYSSTHGQPARRFGEVE